MANTTTLSISSIINQLSKRYPQLEFIEGENFAYSPPHKVVYAPGSPDDSYILLHEIGHYSLERSDYSSDIELVTIESAAWQEAMIIASTLGITIPDEIIQHSLDSYREWMHRRSLCPSCKSTGIETSRSMFHCLACTNEWRANEARSCQLRRWPTK